MNIVFASASRPWANAGMDAEGDVVATAADPSADPALPPEDSGTTGAGPSLGSSQFDPFGTGGASFSFGDGNGLTGGATAPGTGASGIFPGALPSGSDGAITETQCVSAFAFAGAGVGATAGFFSTGGPGVLGGAQAGAVGGTIVGGLVCGSILSDSATDAANPQSAPAPGDADAGVPAATTCACPTPGSSDNTTDNQDKTTSGGGMCSAPTNTDNNVSTGTCGGNNDGAGAGGAAQGGDGTVPSAPAGGSGGSMVDPSGDSGGGATLPPGAPIHGPGPSESTFLAMGGNAIGLNVAVPASSISSGGTGIALSWMTGIQA